MGGSNRERKPVIGSIACTQFHFLCLPGDSPVFTPSLANANPLKNSLLYCPEPCLLCHPEKLGRNVIRAALKRAKAAQLDQIFPVARHWT